LSIIAELTRELYHGANPYDAARLKYVDAGYPHTNIRVDLIESALTIVQPAFWLEIGTMLGGSATLTAAAIKRMAMPTEIVCIDPFCGDVNMWAWEKDLIDTSGWRFLRLEDCRPTIYDRFIANMLRSGHHDIVLPITATSMVGLRLLRRLAEERRLSALPEIVYLDSAHEVDETFMELRACWEMLPPGGILMGDDWSWPAVRGDVTKFAQGIRTNETTVQRLRDAHPESEYEAGIFLYRGQWLLAR
jgi:predicted O-methyltransferase YrrM